MSVFAPYGDNYPAMSQSQWENAPFNQVEPEDTNVDVHVEITLERNANIVTNDYYEDDGIVEFNDLENAYLDDSIPLPEVLEGLADRLRMEFNKLQNELDYSNSILRNNSWHNRIEHPEQFRGLGLKGKDFRRYYYLQKVLNNIQGWKQTYLEVGKDDE